MDVDVDVSTDRQCGRTTSPPPAPGRESLMRREICGAFVLVLMKTIANLISDAGFSVVSQNCSRRVCQVAPPEGLSSN